MELLPSVKEKLIEKLTITVPLPDLNKEMITELTTLIKDSPGNAELFFRVIDPDENMTVDLIARPVKLSIQKELISYLEACPELEYRIN